MFLAAQHMGHALRRIVHHHGQVIGDAAILPLQHKIVEGLRGEFHGAQHLVFHGEDFARRAAEREHGGQVQANYMGRAGFGFCQRRRAIPVLRAVVAEAPARTALPCFAAHGVQFPGSLEGGIGEIGRQQFCNRALVMRGARGLKDGLAVPIESQPAQICENALCQRRL